MRHTGAIYPTLAVISAVSLFATGGLAIKAIAPASPAPQDFHSLIAAGFYISGMRSLIASIFLGLVFLSKGTFRPAFRLGRAGWATAFFYALVMTSFVTANKLTAAANVIFLQSTMPAWVLLGGALFLGERITWGRIASVLCCVIGMALFFQGELALSDWWGNAIALLAGLFFAIVTLLFRHGRDQNPAAAVMMGNALTALLNFPIAYWLIADASAFHWTAVSWGCFLWLGVFQIGVAYLLYTHSLKHLPAIEVALLALLEPVFNPLLVFIWLGERPSIWALTGGSIILLSVLMRIFFTRDSQLEAAQ